MSFRSSLRSHHLWVTLNKFSLCMNLCREVVYVEKSIAETFHLLNFKNVVVNKIEKEKISLDVVELLFKVLFQQI